jgi:hypothetical protein
MLILDDAYPRWNTPRAASPDGLRFLGLLKDLSLGEAGAWTDPVFVDELDLPKRTEWEQGGAPDQSLQDQSRLWMIELKTEADNAVFVLARGVTATASPSPAAESRSLHLAPHQAARRRPR